MFKVGDRVRVVKDDFDGTHLVGKEGNVVIVDDTQEAYSVVVQLEDFDPVPIDYMMSELLGYPHGSMPFEVHELESA
jgi:CheY-like chemotaxis protein